MLLAIFELYLLGSHKAEITLNFEECWLECWCWGWNPVVTNPERSALSAQLSLRQISKFGSMYCDLVYSNFFLNYLRAQKISLLHPWPNLTLLKKGRWTIPKFNLGTKFRDFRKNFHTFVIRLFRSDCLVGPHGHLDPMNTRTRLALGPKSLVGPNGFVESKSLVGPNGLVEPRNLVEPNWGMIDPDWLIAVYRLIVAVWFIQSLDPI